MNGKRAKSGEDQPALRDLRRWKKLRKLKYKEIQELWGLGHTAVYKRLYGIVALRLPQRDALLERLGLSPEELERGVATGFHPGLILEEVLAGNRSQARHLVRYYLSRPPAKAYDTEQLRRMADGLEALRFRDRDAAWARAVEILRTPDLDPEVEGEAWGVLGVMYRYEGRIAVTAFCLIQARRVGGSDQLQARTWQRFAMLLLLNVGDASLALESIRRATACYKRCGDQVGVGKTLVDEGVIYGNSGAYQKAISAYEAGLKLLGEEAFENRFSALQGAAIAHVYLGAAGDALHYLDRVLVLLAGTESSYLFSCALWLRGEIFLLLDQLGKAGECFRAVQSRYFDLERGPLDVALISLRIAKVYFLQNDRRRLRAVMEEMLLSLGDVERFDKILGAAFGEFLAASARGQMSTGLLERIYRKMREGAKAPPPILPLSLPPTSPTTGHH